MSKEKPRKVNCPYCNQQAAPATGRDLYPHRKDLYHLRFYRCAPCGASVGTHRGSWKPLGRLANEELRAAKGRAHGAFDAIWKGGVMSRRHAYMWLADALAIPAKDCHIGMFDVDQCQRVVELCRGLKFAMSKPKENEACNGHKNKEAQSSGPGIHRTPEEQSQGSEGAGSQTDCRDQE